MSDEIPLDGGRVTAGVARIGDTVRRPLKASQLDLAQLLDHLHTGGFDGAPRFLGIDGKNRAILTYLAGEVPRDLGHYEDEQLAAAARLLRRFHDATADFPPIAAAAAEVVCHNDFTPPNAVFRDGRPCAMIDFDTAVPGTRLWDLGYSAVAWLDLGNTDYTGAEQTRRLKQFTSAYDHPSCAVASVAVHAVARQTALAAIGDRMGDPVMRDWASASATWTA